MKRNLLVSRALSSIALVAGFMTGDLHAQLPQYNTGTGTSANVFPLGNATNRCQWFYMLSDFTSPPPGDMAISRIYLQCGGNSGSSTTTYTNFKVMLKQVDPSITGFSSATWETGMTTVIAPVTKTLTGVTAQWIPLDLDQPFVYDPAMNLVVDVQSETAGSIYLYYYSATGGRRLYGSYTATNPNGPDQCRYNFGVDLVPRPTTNPPIPPLSNFRLQLDQNNLWKNSPGVIVNTSTYSDFNYWNITGYSAISDVGPWLPFTPNMALKYDPVIGDSYLIDTVTNKTNLYYTFTERGYYRIKLTTRSKYGMSFVEKAIFVDTPNAKPVALFYTSKANVGVTDKAQFYDLSRNGPTSWSWWTDPPCWVCGIKKNEFFDPLNVKGGINSTVPNPYLQAVDVGVYKVCLAVSNNMGSDTSCVPSAIRVLPGYEMCFNSSDTVAREPEGYVFPITGDTLVSYSATSCPSGFRIAPCADTIKIYLERLRLRNQDSVYVQNSMLPGAKIFRRYGGSNMNNVKDSLKTLVFAGQQLFIRFTPGAGTPAGTQVMDSGFAFRWSSVAATYPKPKAGFSSPDTVYSGYKVIFQNTSSGVSVNYSWDMNGDGIYGKDKPLSGIDSITMNPSQTYITGIPMTKTVSLRSYNCRGSDTVRKTFLVLPTQIAPYADFTVNRTDGFTTDSFVFMDRSINGAKSWLWRFEPNNVAYFMGTDSTSQNPVVYLNGATSYNVTLIATNDFGSNQIKKTGYVTAKTYPSSGSQFQPQSSGEDFGISRVRLVGSIGTIDTTTAMKPSDGSAYTSMYKIQKTTVYRGATYSVEVYRSSAADSQNTRVWIDYNRDASYLGADETILSENKSVKLMTDKTFTIPSNASIGNSRMLVGVSAGFSPINPVISTLGVYEDYGLIIGMDLVKPVVQLIGPSTYKTELNKKYIEPGATAIDNIQGDISNNVKISGEVDTTRIGYYELKYYVNDNYGNPSDTVIRIVQVEVNQTGPSITLKGSDTVYLEVNVDTYSEPGYTAADNKNQDITGSVIVTNNIDTAVLGSYLYTYTVNDAFGFMAVKIRTVIVRDSKPPVISSRTGKDSVYHQIGTPFEENNYIKVSDNYWDALSGIRVSGEVNSDNAGIYNLTFDASDGSGNHASLFTLHVVVTNLIPPVISLNGSTDMTIPVFSKFNDPGATGKDYKFDPVNITVDLSKLNINVTGDYYVTYTATDKYGNSASIKRLVRVRDLEAPVITLFGENPFNNKWLVYNDPGYKVTDNYDLFVEVIVDVSRLNTSIPGTYVVYYNAKDASGNKAQQKIRYVVVEFTGLSEDAFRSGNMQVYPNPSRGLLNVETMKQERIYSVKVYNITGSLVKEYIYSEDSGQDKVRIDLGTEKEGIYLLRVECEGKTYTSKVNINR